MSRLDDAKLQNERVDRLTHLVRDPLPFDVVSSADMERLRREWLKRDSIPCLVPGRNSGANHAWPGLDVRTLLSGDNSGGRISAHDIIIAPGAGLPAHYQQSSDMYLFVMEGEVELTIGHLPETSRRESFAYAPSETTTAWRNNGAEPARLYVLYSPAGPDRAFAEAHQVWERSHAVSQEAYLGVLERYEFCFDAKGALKNDSRTNLSWQRMEASVDSFEDFSSMRERWAKRLPTPKLIHETSRCPSIVLPDGVRSSVIVSGDESGGRAVFFFSALEPGYTAGAHYQPSEEELFFVVDGELELTCGSETRRVGRGAFGFAPRGATHGFKSPEGAKTRILTLNSPAGHERGFEMIMAHSGEPMAQFIQRLSAHGWQLHDHPLT